MESTEKYWKKRFEGAGKEFEDDYQISIWSKHGMFRRINTFFRIFRGISVNKNAIIFDIGCGPGTYTKTIYDMGYKIIGVDYSKPTIMKAIKKSKRRDIYYIVSDAYSLPFKDAYANVIICLGLLQSISNENAIISEIVRTLKKDGIILLMTLNSLSIRIILKEFLYKFLKYETTSNTEKETENQYLRRYNPLKLINIFKNEGFENIEVKGVYVFPEALITIESFLEKIMFFRIIDKLPILSLLFAHSFIIIARRDTKNYYNNKNENNCRTWTSCTCSSV